MDGKEILAEVLKNVNVKGLVVGLLFDQVLKPAILDLVAKSENKFDDAAAAMLMPLAEKSLNDLADKLLSNLGK